MTSPKPKSPRTAGRLSAGKVLRMSGMSHAFLRDASGQPIARVDGPSDGEAGAQLCQANAQHFEACWNAMEDAGIEEPGVVGELVEELAAGVRLVAFPFSQPEHKLEVFAEWAARVEGLLARARARGEQEAAR